MLRLGGKKGKGHCFWNTTCFQFEVFHQSSAVPIKCQIFRIFPDPLTSQIFYQLLLNIYRDMHRKRHTHTNSFTNIITRRGFLFFTVECIFALLKLIIFPFSLQILLISLFIQWSLMHALPRYNWTCSNYYNNHYNLNAAKHLNTFSLDVLNAYGA